MLGLIDIIYLGLFNSLDDASLAKMESIPMLSANRLTMSSIIYPGNKLVIPGASTIKPASSQKPAAVTPLVPSSFLGFSYPKAVVSSANQNKALLNASPVPSNEQMKQIVADTARRDLLRDHAGAVAGMHVGGRRREHRRRRGPRDGRR